jgi:hypothetical protein
MVVGPDSRKACTFHSFSMVCFGRSLVTPSFLNFKFFYLKLKKIIVLNYFDVLRSKIIFKKLKNFILI